MVPSELPLARVPPSGAKARARRLWISTWPGSEAALLRALRPPFVLRVEDGAAAPGAADALLPPLPEPLTEQAVALLVAHATTAPEPGAAVLAFVRALERRPPADQLALLLQHARVMFTCAGDGALAERLLAALFALGPPAAQALHVAIQDRTAAAV